jgi:hypothetical protein
LRIEDAGNSHATDGGRQRQDGNQERRQSSRRQMLSSRLTTISPKTTLKRSCRRVTSDGQLCQLPEGLIGSGTRWTKSRARARALASHHRGAILTLSQDLYHLILAGSLLITAAPALLTTSSWESVPPEQPIAPIITPWSISGIPPRDAMTPSNASR